MTTKEGKNQELKRELSQELAQELSQDSFMNKLKRRHSLTIEKNPLEIEEATIARNKFPMKTKAKPPTKVVVSSRKKIPVMEELPSEFLLEKKFVEDSESQKAMNEIMKNAPFEQEKAIFGNIPERKACVFGYSYVKYVYSGKSKITNPFSLIPVLLQMKEKVEKFVKIEFDHVLVNYYPTGNAALSWHADDEPMIDQTKPIASLSFGTKRLFKIRNNETRKIFEISLENGDLFVMQPGVQEKWKHCIMKDSSVTFPRINLTFRVFKK